jgi:hypothetical protein
MDTAHHVTGKNGQPDDVLHTFFIAPHQCFRMIKSVTSPESHCAEPVVWKGPWRDVTGELWTVEACARHKPTGLVNGLRTGPHAEGLTDRRHHGNN